MCKLQNYFPRLGGNFEDLGQIDGVDQWDSLTDTSKHTRTMVLINIDETRGEEALIFNQWKIVKSNKVLKMYLKKKLFNDFIRIVNTRAFLRR